MKLKSISQHKMLSPAILKKSSRKWLKLLIVLMLSIVLLLVSKFLPQKQSNLLIFLAVGLLLMTLPVIVFGVEYIRGIDGGLPLSHYDENGNPLPPNHPKIQENEMSPILKKLWLSRKAKFKKYWEDKKGKVDG